MRKSTTLLSFVFIGGMLFSCRSNSSQHENQITLTNTTSISLTDKPVAIKRGDIKSIPNDKNYPLIKDNKGLVIPSQLDDLNGDSQWDELFFVVDIPAGADKVMTLSWSDQEPLYTKRTNVRFGKRDSKDTPVTPRAGDTLLAYQLPKSIGYQPYQTDGPSWENDKVGFRHYFDGRNAKDLFGKKVAYMSPEDVGINAAGAVEDNYHVMTEWGRDILGVGNSVGLGGIALMINDSLCRMGVTVNDSVNNVETTTFRIIEKGPVRSIMDFNYINWRAANNSYNVSERTSIWPGMYAYHNSVSVKGLTGNEHLLLGLVNSNTDQSLEEIEINDKWVALLTHDKQTYDKEWWLGMAVIVPKEAYLGSINAPKTGNLATSYFAKMKVSESTPVSYYAVGCWELSDQRFTDKASFIDYVKDLTQQLSAEVKVSIK
jgi:hypothetical protein